MKFMDASAEFQSPACAAPQSSVLLRLLFFLATVFFLLSSAIKIVHFQDFVDAFHGYRLTPARLDHAFAAALIVTEFLSGVAIVFVRTRRIGLLACIGLMVLYSSAVTVTLLNGLEIDCGCNLPGTAAAKTSWNIVVRNGLILSSLLLLLAASERKLSWQSVRVIWDTHYSLLLTSLIVVVLGSTILKLKQSNSYLQEQLRPQGLVAGESVEPFQARLIGSDATEEVNFGRSERTILLIFSTSCPHCEAMIPNWNRRFAAQRQSARIIGIAVNSKDQLDAFLKTHEIVFPVLVPNDLSAFQRNFKVLAVPQIIEVGPDGKVIEPSHTFG